MTFGLERASYRAGHGFEDPRASSAEEELERAVYGDRRNPREPTGK